MLVDAISDARVLGRADPCRIGICAGRVVDVATNDDERSGGMVLRAAGRAVLPAFVDAHVHLDKAFLLSAAEADGGAPARLESAIARVAALRDRVAQREVEVNAVRAVERLIAQGVTALRAHVELDVSVGLRFVEMHRALAERFREQLDMQLVAFPQRGLEMPGAAELFAAALAEGLDVAGGCPYVDVDPRRHLDRVFALAERHGTPVDLHLDFSDDPSRSLLGLVVERTRALGMAGKVTIGHVTTLAAMAPDDRAARLDTLAEAGIALVTLPATDLYLAGQGEPGTRSLAPLENARAAGVRVAIANNNIENPFAPFGNASLVQAAWLAGIVQRADTPAARAALLEAITSAPAQILGLPPHGTEPEAHAHLVVLDSDEPGAVIHRAAAVLATLRAGALVHRVQGPALEAGH